MCVESVESARVAERGGADRAELCSQLRIGGVTPAMELIRATLGAVSIPVHVLVRPRGGDFVYSNEEFELLCRQTREVKAAGAAGVVIGVLHEDGSVDVERTREVAKLAAPLRVTFHRAFDETKNQKEALEDVILTGADLVLTSGGEADVLTGAERIAALQQQAEGRIRIMAGGGLTVENAAEVARRTRIADFHGSLIRKEYRSQIWMPGERHSESAERAPMGPVHLEDVQEMVSLLRGIADEIG